jgi:hypothetical protein
MLIPFLLGIIFQPGDEARLWLVAPFGAISLAGTLYAGIVFVVSGIRADVRRLRKSRNDGD